MEKVTIDKKFKFKCKKCGFCCRFTIILYPFDIMNICKELNISTKEFLKNYAILSIDKDNILRCILKKEKTCTFYKDNGCIVYESRPVRCRLFPIGRYFEDNEIHYLLPKKQKCMGFESKKKISIKEWIDSQNIPQFDKLTNDWNKFIIKLKNNNYPLKDQKFLTMFTKIFYDFDNELINNYKNQMNVKTNQEFMELLYCIAEETLLK